jgi:hypothetical protein
MGPCEVVQESTTSCGCVANHIAAQKNVKYSTAVVDKRSRSRTTFTKKDSHHSFDPSKQSNGILRRFFQWLRALLPLKREKKGKIGQEHKSKYFAKSTGKPKKRTPHNGRHRYP